MIRTASEYRAVRAGGASDVLILCEDARLARLLDNEMAYLGYAVAVSPTEAPALVLLDLDHMPPASEAMLCDGPLSSCALVVWSRDNRPLPPGWGERHRPVIRLHRPFALSELEGAVRRCLDGYVPSAPVHTDPAPEASLPSRNDVRPIREGLVAVGDRTVALTPHEWRLFSRLWADRGRPVSRGELRALLDGSGGNIVEVYICHLRRKLESACGRRLIVTVRGMGYRMEG